MSPGLKRVVRGLLPRRVGSHRIFGGPLRGLRLVTSWHDYPAALLGRTERPLLEWFAAHVRPGDTWLDIGAHYGYTALALARLVGPTGRVFAFEPMLTTAGCLAQTRAINRLDQLTVLPFALGAPAGLEVRALNAVRGMADSTPAAASGNGALTHPAETIIVARGDTLWPEVAGGNPRVHGAKIDVQGMELEVLEGLVGLLGDQQPLLVVEVHAGVDRAALLRCLTGAGYAPTGQPVDPAADETAPRYLDDRSYAFAPIAGSGNPRRR